MRPRSARLIRRTLRVVVVVGMFATIVATADCALFSIAPYAGRASPHFDGDSFRNDPPVGPKGFFDFARWQLTREPDPWPNWIDARPGPAPPKRVGGGQLRVTLINHSTLLVQLDGLNILTDPIYSERASPVSWAGPKRVRDPGIRFSDLPRIDAVVVSHNHYDHMDVPTLRRLAARDRPRIFVGLGNRPFLQGEGVQRVTELDWWERVELAPGVTLVAVPAQHFSGRGLADRNQALWVGFVIRSKRSGNVFFAGDTGFGRHFAEIGRRFGPLRLAMLPIGSYLPRWFMRVIHTSPADAVQAHEVLRARCTVPMHYGTFQLGDDGPDRPLRDLRTALEARRAPLRIWPLKFGEGRDVPL